MNVYRIVSYFLFLTLIVATASAQNADNKPRTPFKDRLVLGGNVIANISNNQTALGLSPRVGYLVSERYITGVGIGYIYQSVSNLSVNSYSASIFNRFYPIEQGYIEAELEYGRVKFETSGLAGDQEVVFNYPALLVGAGVRQGGGDGQLGLSVGIFYDVLQDPNSPYGQQPIFRGGVFFGL